MNATYRIVAPLAGASLLATLVAALSFWAFSQVETSNATRTHIYDLVLRAHALLSEIKDAETGQRGYSLTGDKAFLEPYLAVREGVGANLEQMRQRTLDDAAGAHLDALVPLVSAKMEEMSRVIELRRNLKMTAVLAAAGGSGDGRRLMDSIRAETAAYIQIENDLLRRVDVEFQSRMRRLFAFIIAASLLAFLFALAFAYLIHRDTKHRLGALLHAETQRLLGVHEDTNRQLEQTNVILHISEQKLAVTLDSIGEAVIATDAGGRVMLLNPLAERLTGWTRVAAVGRPVGDIFHIVDATTRLPAADPVKETLAHNTGTSLTNHTILIARDGGECHIADNCAPIRDREDAVVGAVLVFRDVTERNRMDRALQEKNAEYENARSRAEKASLAKSDFLSSMSHELRTPLSAILGFAQLMECGTPQPTLAQKRSIDQILKAGWYLLELINEILDLALIESGKVSLSMEPLSLEGVLRECEAMIEPQAKSRDISVAFPRFAVRHFIQADRIRVKQVLINLLSNALKYNRAGGTVTVDVVTSTAGRIRICVNDTGEGLSAEKLAQLFQPFNRLGKEAGGEEGTGIGLVVCKRLIELMGGEIGVESAVGKGSMFWIDVNLTAEPRLAASPEESTAVARAPVHADAQLRTLLYVEDNPANLMLVEDIVARRPDIRLVSAADGISGVEMARTRLPDVVLMDVNLPGISGLQALQILAANPATAHIPVVALSANAMPRDIEKGLTAGFFRYLTKPIMVDELLATLDVALEYAQTEAARANSRKKAGMPAASEVSAA